MNDEFPSKWVNGKFRIISGLEVERSLAEVEVSVSSPYIRNYIFHKENKKLWDNHYDLVGADTG